MRYPIPGKSFILSALNLSLYTPAAVMGVSLVIAYAFLFRIPQTMTGLIAAYVVGTFPLMLVPVIVALRDLPMVFEEAARTLGATRMQTFWRVEIPLLGPGISAGILLTFVIIFNEFLVTLFIAGPSTTTAALARLQPDPNGGLPAVDRGAGDDHAARLVRRGAALLPLLRVALSQGHVSDLSRVSTPLRGKR